VTDIAFICTGRDGRGAHDPVVPQERDPKSLQIGRRAPRPALRLVCPECGRDVSLGFHVRQKLAASELQQVDISMLPF
jgi:hypothetical protein